MISAHDGFHSAGLKSTTCLKDKNSLRLILNFFFNHSHAVYFWEFGCIQSWWVIEVTYSMKVWNWARIAMLTASVSFTWLIMQESQVYVWDGRVENEGLEFCSSPWLHFISQGGGSQTWSQDQQQHHLELFKNANPRVQRSLFLRRPLVASLMHTKVWEPLSKGGFARPEILPTGIGQ